MSDPLYGPFLQATRDVFALMLDVSDVREHPADGMTGEDAMEIVIGVTGDLAGEVVYRFPRSTSLNMVNILSGMEMDTVDEFVTSAISEIANIISGNVMTILTGKDLHCDILPPVLGRTQAQPEHPTSAQMCIATTVGDVCLEIRVAPGK